MANISAITDREIALVSRFIALLKEEQVVLQRADASALSEISEAKAGLVEQLNALELERRSALGSPADQNTRAAMAEWLTKNPQQQTVAVNWKKLLELAAEAKELHELNGTLLATHLNQTAEALAALTWRAEKTTLYGSDGQTAQRTGSRIVDSA